MRVCVHSSLLRPLGLDGGFLVVASTAPWPIQVFDAGGISRRGFAASEAEAQRMSCELARQVRDEALERGHKVVAFVCPDCPTPKPPPCGQRATRAARA